MGSSSEDSFAWTNASSERTDSDDMAVDPIQESQYDNDESESGKSYKRKLQKKLFTSEEDSNKHSEQSQTSSKKRKLRNEVTNSEEIDRPQIKKVKIEPESDVEINKKKKKSKRNNDSQDLLYCDDDDKYLNMRVKQELASTPEPTVIKSKKKKKKSHSDVQFDESQQESKAVKEKISKNYTDYYADDTNVQSLTNHKTEDSLDDVSNNSRKKKKKKKSKEKLENNVIEENDMTIEDKFTAEETVVQRVQFENKSSGNESIMSEDVEHSIKTSTNNTNYCNSNSDDEMYGENSITNRVQSESKHSKNNSISLTNSNEEQVTKNSIALPEKVHQRTMRISDRIQFEEEHSDIDTSHTYHNQDKVTKSSNLKNFLKGNKNLKSLSVDIEKNPAISVDDELWILKCPHEINVSSLLGSNLSIEEKCKIKTDSKTYDGSINNTMDKIAILTHKYNKYEVKHFHLNGTVHFRKRIPKPHFIEDNIIVNSQTNFIPLLDTKCRHPLFGIHYKKAIKVPSAIAARLETTSDETHLDSTEIKRKKKHKKHKYKEEAKVEIRTERQEAESELPSEQMKTDRQTKKRKRNVNGDDTPQKSKQIKHARNSAEVWDSEKAIEESLFNF